MKFKLDENIGHRGEELLKAAGHDVVTVRAQGLSGTEDERLLTVCAGEERTLITLDHDFGQVLRFPPEDSSGIVILELPPRPSRDMVTDLLSGFLAVLAQGTPGKS